MRKKIMIAICMSVFLAGAAVFLYPSFKTAAVKQAAQAEIQHFESIVADNEEKTDNSESTPKEDWPLTYRKLWDACCAYNAEIYENHQSQWTAYSQTQAAICLGDFGWVEPCFGYLSIPAVNIEYPIYLGGSGTNLNRGAVHLGQTSLPIGGQNTHCVIGGHRSWSGAIMFRGLEDLAPRDKVYITNPWETLQYTVTEVYATDSTKTDDLMIQEGRDLLTVFTCTYPSTRRVIVRCERSDEFER